MNQTQIICSEIFGLIIRSLGLLISYTATFSAWRVYASEPFFLLGEFLAFLLGLFLLFYASSIVRLSYRIEDKAGSNRPSI